ncbi:hypothetical protein DYB38_001605 [Aphanomyces astaci]|uniref:Arginase n=1 Tax=Aphanomyces astaci TaxID=112090 RepID=A0A397CYH1_APHAT|nr:hypothetical protein DYB38_001605 [Aphanomyces astaci]
MSLIRTVLPRAKAAFARRGVHNSRGLLWDEIRNQNHPGDHTNPVLSTPQTVSVIGAPMTHGQPLLGTDFGPDLLRNGGLHNVITDLGWCVEETGTGVHDEHVHMTFNNTYDRRRQPQLSRSIADVVEKKASEGKFCLVLGGDHTIGAGSLAGILKVHPDAGIIWVDAHADINTPQTTESGNMHGMPISFLMQGLADPARVPGFEWLVDGPILKPEQLVYIGLRDVDSGERRIIKELGIKAFSMQSVDKYGIGKTMEMALDHLCGKQARPLHMSYDIDAVDPVDAPSTGTRGTLVGLDMVEVNPSLAPGKGAAITVDMALLLIGSALGNRIL